MASFGGIWGLIFFAPAVPALAFWCLDALMNTAPRHFARGVVAGLVFIALLVPTSIALIAACDAGTETIVLLGATCGFIGVLCSRRGDLTLRKRQYL
ncbi:hypothetical protein M2390_000980 [Mycetocola sp. BIGb0189]|nr:hypothetical protein [Mycetocola sp. BIGb0189]